MRVIVTGGAGFIGSHVVDRLLAEGNEVAAIDNLDPFYSPARKRANLADALGNERFRLIEADLRDVATLESTFQTIKPDVVVHLAARAGVRPSIERPALYAEVNLTGTINVLEAVRKLSVAPKFLLASSSSVYGDRLQTPFRESDPVDRPVSPYAATKRACELIAYTYHDLYEIQTTALRFFTAYGPRNRPDLAMYKFADLIDRGLPVPMFGDGTSMRDYTYIEDVVNGVARAIDRCAGYEIYNIGNHSPVELSRLIELIGRELGKTPIVDRLPDQAGDVKRTFADISKARAELGFEPDVTIEEGVARFVGWFQKLR